MPIRSFLTDAGGGPDFVRLLISPYPPKVLQKVIDNQKNPKFIALNWKERIPANVSYKALSKNQEVWSEETKAFFENRILKDFSLLYYFNKNK